MNKRPPDPNLPAVFRSRRRIAVLALRLTRLAPHRVTPMAVPEDMPKEPLAHHACKTELTSNCV